MKNTEVKVSCSSFSNKKWRQSTAQVEMAVPVPDPRNWETSPPSTVPCCSRWFRRPKSSTGGTHIPSSKRRQGQSAEGCRGEGKGTFHDFSLPSCSRLHVTTNYIEQPGRKHLPSGSLNSYLAQGKLSNQPSCQLLLRGYKSRKLSLPTL